MDLNLPKNKQLEDERVAAYHGLANGLVHF
jgi:hypothetical protein